MYEVRLTKPMTQNVYKPGYFPRRVKYKAAAQDLVRVVRELGGDAEAKKLEIK